jgi:uncharacterized repeat protein (TIGR03837 family)
MPGQQWDLFCRVVDNLRRRAGVCWRLARAPRSTRASQCAWSSTTPRRCAGWRPAGAPGVQVLPWPGPAEPGDVVIEAFGCDPPPAFVASDGHPVEIRPVWINLEYLSAEAYVERSHGLPSPQRNGLTKWFYFPGFTARTGGCCATGCGRRRLRRPGWLAGQGWRRSRVNAW